MNTALLILGLLLLRLVLYFLYWYVHGGRTLKRAAYSKPIPIFLQQADELYANIQYQDDHIIVSDRVLANKKAPFQMCWREEAYGIYQHTASMNFISYTNEIIVCTKHKKNILRFNVYAKGKDTAMGLCNCFPNVVPTQW